MPKIVIMRGLPASGKTTLARRLVDSQDLIFKRVNKDDLRAMLDAGTYSPEKEKFILKIRDEIIKEAIRNDFNVVVDDTNLNPSHVEWLQVLATLLRVEVEILDVDTPLEECIERDAAREKPVGEYVIRQIYEKYMKGKNG